MTTITAQRPTAPGTRRQSYVVADAITMLRRNLLHMVRYPGLSVFTIVGPVVFLLLFVFVFGVGLLIGFRPTAGPIEWIAAVGMIVLIAFAITWLAVAMGMQVKSVETASNLPMVLILLPFLGSGFVPTESMPVWLQGFAQYQPFTPFIETIRGLLLGTQLGSSPALAIGWCVVITGAGYAWSTAIYERKSVR